MNFLIIKPTRRTNFPNLFCQEILHVSGSSSAHHQELFTVHSALVYVIKLAWHISVPNVQWKIPDDGQRNCPKHVVFIIKKFVTMHGNMNVKKKAFMNERIRSSGPQPRSGDLLSWTRTYVIFFYSLQTNHKIIPTVAQRQTPSKKKVSPYI